MIIIGLQILTKIFGTCGIRSLTNSPPRCDFASILCYMQDSKMDHKADWWNQEVFKNEASELVRESYWRSYVDCYDTAT